MRVLEHVGRHEQHHHERPLERLAVEREHGPEHEAVDVEHRREPVTPASPLPLDLKSTAAGPGHHAAQLAPEPRYLPAQLTPLAGSGHRVERDALALRLELEDAILQAPAERL